MHWANAHSGLGSMIGHNLLSDVHVDADLDYTHQKGLQSKQYQKSS